MPGKHITLRMIQDMIEGRITASEFIVAITEHCSELCPICRQNLSAAEDILKELPSQRPSSVIRPTLSADVLVTIERIRQMSDSERLSYVTRLVDREAGVSVNDLVLGFLSESRSRLPDDVPGVLSWATLAYEALVTSGSERHDLFALAFGYIGNAHRIREDIFQARDYLEKAAVAAGRSDNPDAKAEIASLRGSLFTMMRLYEAATGELLEAALLIKHRNPVSHAEILIKLGIVCDLLGEPQNAITVTKRALVLIEKENETRLYLYARFNLAQHLFTAERFDECRALLAEDEDLWNEQHDAWTELRLWWLQARLAAEGGDEATAERAFRAIRRSFIEREEGFETALVTLDLVLLYHRQGRSEELLPLVEEMLDIFLANEMHPEVFSALRLLSENLKRSKVSEATIKKCYRFVREASATPHAAGKTAN